MSDPNQNSGTSELIATAIVTVAVSGVVVVLRFITRLRILHLIGSEDWCIWLAYMLSIGNTIGMTYQAKFALGRHLATLSPEQLSSCSKAFYATVLSYGLSLTFTKLSILFQYLRIFRLRKLLIACYTLIAIVALYGLEILLTGTFPCWPVASFWDEEVKGRCLPNDDIWYMNAALNITTDLLIFMLPIPVIKGLNLPARQKAALLGVFLLGFLYAATSLLFVLGLVWLTGTSVCMISIMRLPSLKKAAATNDFTYDNIGIAVWSCIEVNIAIICACLPAMKPLFSHFFPGLLSTGKQTTRSNYMRHGSSRDATSRRTWYQSTSSKTESAVGVRTVHDLESGTALAMEGDDLALESLKSQARTDITNEEIRQSEGTQGHNESSLKMGTRARSTLEQL